MRLLAQLRLLNARLRYSKQKNDASLFSLRNFKILTNICKKFFFEILVLTALTVGLIWTILELTPKSALLSLIVLQIISKVQLQNFFPFLVLTLEKFLEALGIRIGTCSISGPLDRNHKDIPGILKFLYSCGLFFCNKPRRTYIINCNH